MSLFNIFGKKPENTENDATTHQQENAQEIKSEQPEKITKLHQVRLHLLNKGSIDSWTAINLYGATRLSAIIFNLRKRGMIIDSIPCSALDRNSNVCNYTTYKLITLDETN